MINRSVYLGDTVTANILFMENGTVLETSDALKYPSVYVKDPEGNLVFAGVGTFDTDDLYHTEFEIPDDAVISSDTKYYIEWELKATNGKMYKAVEYFDVFHPSYNLTDSKEQQKLVLPFTPLYVSVPLPSIPSAIEFNVLDNNDTVLVTLTPTNKGVYSNYYIYTTTIPANTFTASNDYGLLWKFTLGTENHVFFQKAMCCDTWSLTRIADLRMLADKYLKDIDLYTGYRDSDLYFHLLKGLDHLNMLYVPTDWTILKMKGTVSILVPGLMTCALYSLLRAQYLAEGDASFNYSGQPVSLDVDRSQYIEAEIGRLENEIENVVKPAKKQFLQRGRMVGALGLVYPSVGNTIGGISRSELSSRSIPYR